MARTADHQGDSPRTVGGGQRRPPQQQRASEPDAAVVVLVRLTRILGQAMTTHELPPEDPGIVELSGTRWWWSSPPATPSGTWWSTRSRPRSTTCASRSGRLWARNGTPGRQALPDAYGSLATVSRTAESSSACNVCRAWGTIRRSPSRPSHSVAVGNEPYPCQRNLLLSRRA